MTQEYEFFNVLISSIAFIIGIYLYKVLNDIWSKVKGEEEAKIRWYYFLSFGIITTVSVILISLANIVKVASLNMGIRSIYVLVEAAYPLLISALAIAILVFAHERLMGGRE